MLEQWKRPQHYIGADWTGYLAAPVSQHRDSDSVERSNWRVFLRSLKEASARDENDSAFEDDLPFEVVRENHFLVGWVEWIAIDPRASACILTAQDAARRLEEYPVLSDDDLSELEFEEEQR